MAIQAKRFSDDQNHEFQLVGNSQDLIQNTCGMNGVSLDLLQQHQQQLQKQQQYLQFLQTNQNLSHQNQSMVFSQTISAEFEKHKQEIDECIRIQNERLRLGLLRQQKHQLQSILKNYECQVQILLRRKDEEIAKAVNRTMELEDFLTRMEFESQKWQSVAKENEAMIVSLNNTIERLKESANISMEDAESCCENWGGDDDDDHKEEENQTGKLICRSCNSGKSCLVLLPCKHLCSCRDCEFFLDSCPVCSMVKTGSIEVLF